MRWNDPKPWLIALVPLALVNAGPLSGKEAPQISRADKETPAQPATTARKAPLYCTREAIIGTRVPRKFCYTREEWLARGWDPLEN